MSTTATSYILPYLVRFIQNWMNPWDYEFASEDELWMESCKTLQNSPNAIIEFLNEQIEFDDDCRWDAQFIINHILALS